jgi:hypothetical protein
MARQTINVGATANDGTGDGIRTAYIKCNDNFKELFDTTITPIKIVNGTSNIAVANNANVTISVAGSANVVTFSGLETVISGNVTIATDLDVGNSLTITQDVTIGDQIIINGSVGSNIFPDTNNSRNLGNATLRYASVNSVLINATGNITATGNVAGGNITTAGAITGAAISGTSMAVTGTAGTMTLNTVTTTQRNALSAANGMIVYNSTTSKIEAYAGGAWVQLH